jgi:hypothetical protein
VGNSVNEKKPVPLVTALWTTLVPSLTTWTLAPEITAPLESVTVPDRFAKIDWASAAGEPDSKNPTATAMKQARKLVQTPLAVLKTVTKFILSPDVPCSRFTWPDFDRLGLAIHFVSPTRPIKRL